MPRFTIDTKKTMRVGKEVYTALVKKMLSVHIAHIDRRMKACVQCPARCRPAAGDLKRDPYTRPYKDQENLPREMLPLYLQTLLRDKTKAEGKIIRRNAEQTERQLREADGNVDRVEQRQRIQLDMLQAQFRAFVGEITPAPRHRQVGAADAAAVAENLGQQQASVDVQAGVVYDLLPDVDIRL